MTSHGPLIATIVAALVLAFGLGTIAHRLRISPLVGYLLAGVAVGPFTPGFVANQPLATELAEIGVILLMFGVGLHFSFKELLAVRWIAVPGAVVQISVATLLGMGLGWLLGWDLAGGFVFGLALSVASTVVLLRALQERRLVETERGRVAVGWLIVEDIAMVLALVLLPAIADALGGGASPGATAPIGGLDAVEPDSVEAEVRGEFGLFGVLALTLGKVVAFVVMMLVVGRRVIPWILHYIAHTGSRELFRLSVLAVALGVAYGASVLFDVSFALGAFFAGMILSESELSQQAAEESLPLRDAFAVLFFVSVGMLFDPSIILREPWSLLGTLAIILIGKSIAALAIVRAFGHSMMTALTISASLAQIGEFSFILAGLGVALGVLSEAGQDLILAGAILSIMANPLAFSLIDRLRPGSKPAGTAASAPAAAQVSDLQPTELSRHAIVVGFGRVGSVVADGLSSAGYPVLAIEERTEAVQAARDRGIEALVGNAADPNILAAANLQGAQLLMVAVPGAFDAGQIVEQARAANPGLRIVARAHSDAEVEYLMGLGASSTIMGEREIARGMLEEALKMQASDPESPPQTAL
ncbi:MAG: cation:proton antiporter [Dongiaceae bacterium]